MSYPKGDHQSPQHGHGTDQRPGFDRPSLFAGMEDDETPEDTRRVRILSTLESTRQTSRPSRTKGGRRTRKPTQRSWLQGALWGVLGVGVVALMAGFVMVIQDSKPALAHTPPPAATRQARNDIASPKLSTLPPAAAGPAVIETPTASAAPVAAPEAPATLPAVPPMAADTVVASNKPTAAAVRASKAAPAPAAPGKSTSKPANNAAPKGQDEDVALLEAMFAHTGRKAAPKPAPAKN